MKPLLIYLVILCLVQSVYAKKNDEKDVIKVVNKVLTDENKSSKKIDKLIPSGLENDTTIYIAKLNGGGFIVVSADDAAVPVLVLNLEGDFDMEKMPSGLLYLIEKYQYSIGELRKNKIEAPDKVKVKWEHYLGSSDQATLKSALTVNSVSPMIETSWRQAGYNQYYPSGCSAGCTAVAMARILYHWRAGMYPEGSNTHDGQTANFGSTNYNMCLMSATSPDNYNSLLIYHAGISCNTDYDTDGSSSTTTKAKNGFVNFWGLHADKKERILNLLTWEDMMYECLDQGRPILYGGSDLWLNGHNWVIDGYDSDGKFSCKWGWSTSYDSYCYLGNFDPDGDNGPYNQYEDAIFDIYPLYEPGIISGPATLTNSGANYSVPNPIPFAYATWTFSSNIQSVYGGNDFVVLRSLSSGTGWIQASYNFCGKSISFGRIYVTLSY